MNFASTKRRLLQYLDFKGITVAKFFVESEIKRGLLDSDKLDAAVSDIHLAKIIATYPDVNLYWLITGVGNMILENITTEENTAKSAEEYLTKISSLQDNLLEAKNEIIRLQTQLINSPEKREAS